MASNLQNKLLEQARVQDIHTSDTMTCRQALHQRCDSDTNVTPLPRNLKHPEDISLRASSPHKATSSVKPNLDFNNSQFSARNDTVRSIGTTRSSTIRSTGTTQSARSLDSLPPVPPLRIHKDRTSIPLHWADKEAGDGTDKSLSYKDNRVSVSTPRSVPKKLPELSLPPVTPGEYQNASMSWAGEHAETPFQRPTSFFTSPTLRIVKSEDKDSQTDMPPTITLSTESLASRSKSSSSLDNQNQATGQFPVWARYFYGRHTGNCGVTLHPDNTGGKATTNDVSNKKTSRRAETRDAAEFLHIPATAVSHNSEVWSLPHLDHKPFARVYKLDRQIILFCIGFIFPLCWFIAAFLPLPEHINAAPSHRTDPESAFTDECITRSTRIEFESHYENARWWRRINRSLSILGVLIIVAIILLVLIAIFLK